MTLTHSYSGLSCFEICPRQYYERYIERKYKADSKEIQEGYKIHQQLEDYLNGKSIDPERKPDDNLLEALHAAGAKPELGYAVTKDLKPTGFWDDDAYIRMKLDVTLITPRWVIPIDWKTGKRFNKRGVERDNSLQAKTYSLAMYIHYPDLPNKAIFDYLEQGRQEPYKFTREQAEEVVTRAGIIDRTTKFVASPGPLCGWCPVITCEHNKEFRR